MAKFFKKQVPNADAMAVAAVAAAKMADVIKGKPDPEARESAPVRERSLLQRIDFDYQDLPSNHGWEINGNPSFSFLSGGMLGIAAAKLYSMHYDVEPIAYSGKSIEFVAKYEAKNTAVYAKVAVQRQDSSEHKAVWLKIKIGARLSAPSQDGSSEWVWYMQPTSLDDGWAKFEVDLPLAVEQTFGTDGWSYRELMGFRLRGNLKIAYISVYG
jgi:hypothetical protein